VAAVALALGLASVFASSALFVGVGDAALVVIVLSLFGVGTAAGLFAWWRGGKSDGARTTGLVFALMNGVILAAYLGLFALSHFGHK